MNPLCHGCGHAYSWHGPELNLKTGLLACVHISCKCPQFHTEADIITDEQTKNFTRYPNTPHLDQPLFLTDEELTKLAAKP